MERLFETDPVDPTIPPEYVPPPRETAVETETAEPAETEEPEEPGDARAVKKDDLGPPDNAEDLLRRLGSGQFVNPEPQRAQRELTIEPSDNGEFSVNLVDVPVVQAARAILGQTLGLNYSVAEDVGGTVTFLASNTVNRSQLLESFRTVLELNGLSLTLVDGVYVVKRVTSAVPSFIVQGETSLMRNAVHVIPLKFVSAANMISLLEPIIPASVRLYSSASRNMMFVIGGGGDLQSILNAVNLFDVDILKGKSISLVKLKRADPGLIVGQLQQVFETYQGGPLQGVLRFIPNQTLRSVLIISSQASYIPTAEAWIKRFEQAMTGGHQTAVVYHLENRSATELAPVLAQLMSSGALSAGDTPATGQEQGQTPSQPGSPSGVTGSAFPPVSVAPTIQAPQIPALPQIGQTGSQAGSSQLPQITGSRSGSAVGGGGSGGRIVADEASNSIIAVATPAEHEQLEQLVLRLDSVANQVLIEATIAEVVLTDELEYGVRWFFEQGNYTVNFAGAGQGSVLPNAIIPGFNAVLATSGLRVVLSALDTLTDINVVSSPSLLVLDNGEAVLRVGDRVPVATQSAVSVANPDAPIVNSISQQDTGVLLRIRPRVSSTGRVILNIDQEVSDVVATTTSGIDSPTIQQRMIRTTVAVDDGQSVALGGLIRTRRAKTRSGVPGLSRIPVFGGLFGTTDDTDTRTELLVIITPRLIRDSDEAKKVTDEFRRRLQGPDRLLKGDRSFHHFKDVQK